MATSPARQRAAQQHGHPIPQQQKRPQIELLPENKEVRRRAPAKIPYIKYGMIVASVFAVVILILSGYSELTALTAQNTDLKEELAELQSNENALNAKKEQLYNLEYVEQCAQDMGMVKQDSSQVTYVDLSNSERSAIAQDEDDTPSLIAGLVSSFNAVVEYLN